MVNGKARDRPGIAGVLLSGAGCKKITEKRK